MNKRVYILLVFVLSFAFANAQSTATEVNVETTKTVSVSEDNVEVVNETLKTKQDVLIISEEDLRESIARTSSDIRTYFNRERNVENIKLLFPTINKAKKA
ncbi:hypothetical protein E1J38_007415 [Seonamhaeicola sediminis]|uniref:TonB-dependent receptor n=1 Tax=Seonamhaeicola sediminis TaxID=2528206 RepID=A0A562YDD2_9FLAO|nr:hypothetical protein [Seonamhaeicola sediminis]TWO32687.1 hypothetical protein E1J38_007415 [Seonamhaeicola sediminis]